MCCADARFWRCGGGIGLRRRCNRGGAAGKARQQHFCDDTMVCALVCFEKRYIGVPSCKTEPFSKNARSERRPGMQTRWPKAHSYQTFVQNSVPACFFIFRARCMAGRHRVHFEGAQKCSTHERRERASAPIHSLDCARKLASTCIRLIADGVLSSP